MCPTLKLDAWFESHLTSRCLSSINALLKTKFPSVWFCNTGVKPPFSKITWLFFKNENTAVSKKTIKIISVKDLLHWRRQDCHTWWKLAQSLGNSLKLDLSLIHVVNFNGNQISTLVDFSTRTPLTLLKMDEKWRWNQMWKFCS